MKSTFRLATVIISLSTACTFANAKTLNMTTNDYNLKVNKIDSSITGTWEMNPGTQKMTTTIYCQFNNNGTFISFEGKQNKYTVTGRGKWRIKNGAIYIIHGSEISVPVVYDATENRLIFGENVYYTKPSTIYASK